MIKFTLGAVVGATATVTIAAWWWFRDAPRANMGEHHN
jgi:hypothetical protein